MSSGILLLTIIFKTQNILKCYTGFMKKLVFILSLFLQSFAYSQVSADKRELVLQAYAENLSAFWKTMENVPLDFLVSSLAITLPSGNENVEKAKVALMYAAAIMAMEGAKAEIKNLGKCKRAVDKYSAQSKIWITPESFNKNCLQTSSAEKGVCLGLVHQCKVPLIDFLHYYEAVTKFNEKLAREKIDYPSELSQAGGANSYLWLDLFLVHVKDRCGNAGVEQRAAAVDLENSCKDLIDVTSKDMAQRWGLIFTRSGQSRINFKHIHYRSNENGACPQGPGTQKQAFAPLYFSDWMYKAGDKECGGTQFAGIFKGERELLMVNSRWRAFYWMMMAEKMDEDLKKMTFANTNDLSNYKIEGSIPCNSPMDDNQKCMPYASLLKSLVAERKYFEDGRDVQDIALIGDKYNSKQPITKEAIEAFNRLAKKLPQLRDMARNHKSGLRNSLEYERVPLKIERVFY